MLDCLVAYELSLLYSPTHPETEMFGRRTRRQADQEPLTTFDNHKLGWRDLDAIKLRDRLPTAGEAMREMVGFFLVGAVFSTVFIAVCVAVLG